MNHDAQKNQCITLGALALALAAGAIGPWASVFGLISIGPTASAEVSLVVFGGIAVLVASAATGRRLRAASITIGILALAEAGYALVKVVGIRNDNEFGQLVQPGWGLYLTIIAAIALIASTFVVKPLPAPAVEPTTSVAPPVAPTTSAAPPVQS